MEQKDMQGVLVKAREKRSTKSPDYTGRVLVNGVEYALSGWVRSPKDGEKYIGLALRVREERHPQEKDGALPF